MDQYLSTYRKDFLWPYVRKFPIGASSEAHSEGVLLGKPAGNGRVSCTCGAETGGLTSAKEYFSLPDARAHSLSRLRPPAALLDPKLYPAKMGPAPEFELTRYDQPNTYLKKLQEKYPFLYKVLQSAPPDDMIRPVNQDRLRTTYQVDYGHMDEHTSVGYDKLLGKAGISWPDYSDTRTNRPGRFEEPRDVVHYTEFGGILREDTNHRGGFRYDARGFEDSREGRDTNYRGGFRYNNARALEDSREGQDTNYRGGFRYNARGFEDSRETEDTNYRGGFKYNARGFEDSHERANKNYNGPLRDHSEAIPREFGDSREDPNKTYAPKNESSQSAEKSSREVYSREAANTRRAETAAVKSDDGAVGGKKNDSGAFYRFAEVSEDGKGLPAWRSEYQEVIGQTGYDIIRDKMHRHGARSTGRNFIERIIMKCRAM